jgi:hypothetical protein
MDTEAQRLVETSLGLPEDPDERRAWYEHQRVLYKPWNQRTFCPDWTLAEGKCRNCEAETLVVRAGGMDLCLMWCLNTGLQLYPSGEQHPKPRDFLKHAKTCKRWYGVGPPDTPSILHSWYLTSKYSDALKTAFMFSSPTTPKTSTSKFMSSSTAKAKTINKSSSGLPLPNLVLSNRQ